MKTLSPDYQLSRISRAGGNPVYKKIPAKQDRIEVLFASRADYFFWIPACAGKMQIRFIKSFQLVAALLLSCISISTAHADTQKSEKLGRLFFTPEQRQQLDYAYARSASAEGNSSAVLTVNGIVQRNGGARTVWVNGMSQNIDNKNERNPTAQSVTVPGKQQPVKLKVGDKILLDQTTPPPQEATVE